MVAEHNNIEITNTLLNYAEEAQIAKDILLGANNYGNSPLITAAAYGNQKIVTILLAAAEQQGIVKEVLQQPSKRGIIPLLIAVDRGYHEIAESLLALAKKHGVINLVLQQCTKEERLSVLHMVAKNNNIEIINTLLNYAEKAQIAKEMLISNDEPLHLQTPATTGNLEQACNSFPEEITALSNQTPTIPESLNQPELSADPRL